MTLITFTAEQVRALVPMDALIARLRAALVEAETGAWDCPPRHSFGDGLGLVMPAYHRPSGATVTKCLSLLGERTPAITGCAVWTSPVATDTVVADASAVTTLRTGAMVGVATDLYAAPDSTRLVVFGAGAQAGDQVRAVAAVRPIRHVSIINRQPPRAATLIEELSIEFPAIEFGADPDALESAHVVCCATSSSEPVFAADRLPDRVHVNAIGSYRPSMHELPAGVLAAAEVLAVDDVEAVRAESGEVIDAIADGLIRADALVPLGRALQHPRPDARRTVFKSVGTGVQDWVVMDLLAQASR